MDERGKPRIMLVIKDLRAVGGAQLNTLRLASRLMQAGFQMMIMGYGDRESIKNHLRRFKISPDIQVYPITPASGMLSMRISQVWPNIFFVLPSLYALWKFRKHFDILHGPLLMESGLVCALSSIFLGKPSLVKIGSAGYYGDVKRALRVAAGAPRRALFRRITKFVCLTREIEDELNNELDLPRSKLIRIPNGVDIERFRPVNKEQKRQIRSELGINPEGKVILFVGRLELKKRVDFLLKAWAKVQENRDGTDRLLIVGDGSLRPMLEKTRDDMEKGETVIFHGESEDIKPIMQAADIFVLPSVSEGLANVFLESMASGLPVIATNTSGNAEILRDNENGRMFKEKDFQDLADTILFLLEDDTSAARLGENARRTAEERFNLVHIVEQYIDLYQTLAHERA